MKIVQDILCEPEKQYELRCSIFTRVCPYQKSEKYMYLGDIGS